MSTTRDRYEDVPRPPAALRRAGAWGWAIVGLAAGAVVVAVVLGALAQIVVPFVLALLAAAVLSPVVSWLMARGWPRAAAALTVAIGGALALLVVIGALVTLLVREMAPLLGEIRDGLRELQAKLRDSGVDAAPGSLGEVPDQVRDLALTGLTGLASSVFTITDMVIGAFVALVVLIFLLKDGPMLWAFARRQLMPGTRRRVERNGPHAWRMIGRYVGGTAVVGAVDATFTFIGLTILGVPLALPLSLLVFFGGFVPWVGAFLTGAAAVAVALGTEGLQTALWTLALVIAVQALDGNLISPVVVGRAVELHPLAILTVVFVGGAVAGLVGALLAVPTLAFVRTISAPPPDPEQPAADDAQARPPPSAPLAAAGGGGQDGLDP